jgi:hypothetical protein
MHMAGSFKGLARPVLRFIWCSASRAPACSGSKFRIVLDTRRVADGNEIDAVELVGRRD